MIKALSALGGDNTIQLVLSYSNGSVAVTATITPNDEALRTKGRRVLQVVGTVDEVDAELPKALSETVGVVTAFQTNLAAIEAENKKAIEEAKAKPAPAAKPEKKAKHKSEPEPAPVATPEPAAPATGELNLDAIIAEANAKK